MLDAVSWQFAETEMLRVAPFTSIFSVSAFHGAKPGLDAALAVTLPQSPNFVRQNGFVYMWSGPNSWLVFGADMADLAAAKPYAAITEQSDGRVVFEVAGAHAKLALAKTVPIDLHDDAFAIGATALTLAGHINVQIWRVADTHYHLACFRSFAIALYDTLNLSCREFES
jgi:sarcosine oxidase subunit gamma